MSKSGNAPDLMLWDQTKYTDWQRLFGNAGSVTTINADLSGGMSQTTYGISANYTSTTEIMNNGGKNKRGSIRSNINHISKSQKFKVNVGSNLALTDVASYLMGKFGSLAPNAPDIYNDKGAFNFEPYRGQYSSEFGFGQMKRPSFSSSFQLQSHINVSYELLQGLSISTIAGYNFSFNENSNLDPLAANDPFYTPMSSATFGNGNNKSYTIEPQIRYQTAIGKGILTSQLLGSVQDVKTKGNTIFAMDFPNDNLMKSYNNANALYTSMFEGYAEYRYISAAAIINYNWDNKYILNLNARRDGSTKFGPGKQFGNFGSMGAAWIVSDENWMQAVLPNWFSFFKLRGSYGITGSDGIKDYEYLSRWGKNYSDRETRNIYKYNNIDAFTIIGALNQQFQWESTKKRELAAQFGFMNNKINMDVSYYSNISGNQLTSVPMPSYTGVKSVMANWPAKVSNAGWEMTLSANLVNSKDWNVNVNFNIGQNKNKLVSFPHVENTPYANRYIVGEALSTRYLLHYTGINPINGKYTFEDYNKNGKLDNLGTVLPDERRLTDRYVKLDLAPKYAGGFGIAINYKKLAVQGNFSYVNKLSPDPYLSLQAGGKVNLVLPEDILENRWQNPGDIAKYPKFSTLPAGPIMESDAGYTNGSYVRMSNLAIAYSLPSKWVQRVGMKDASIAIQTQNLFTITSYKGFDPDIPTLTGFSPIPRTISTSIRFNF